MSSYKEIVTKAVIGKGKKVFNNKYSLISDDNVDTVLGCWVINHNLNGTNNNGLVDINGNFDVNIWYSYDNNTKTNVATKNINYEELVKVNLKEDSTLTNDSEIIIRSLKNPSCIDVEVNGNKIEYTIEKELGIEVIGDAKVKIVTEDQEDDYEIIEDDEEVVEVDEETLKQVEEEVKEDYLKEES